MAPICGTPNELRTYPEMTPGLSAADTGSTRPIAIIRNPSLRSIAHLVGNDGLFDGKSRRRVHRLVRKLVVYFDLDPVHTWIQVRCRKRLLQGDLIAYVAHLLCR